MKLRLLPILLFPLATAHTATTFVSGVHTFTMDFVTIGNAVNLQDDTGYGKVDYTYQVGAGSCGRLPEEPAFRAGYAAG